MKMSTVNVQGLWCAPFSADLWNFLPLELTDFKYHITQHFLSVTDCETSSCVSYFCGKTDVQL